MNFLKYFAIASKGNRLVPKALIGGGNIITFCRKRYTSLEETRKNGGNVFNASRKIIDFLVV